MDLEPEIDHAMATIIEGLDSELSYEEAKTVPDTSLRSSKLKRTQLAKSKKHKARLVAREFTQIYVVDYYGTYAPIARMTSFRTTI